MGVIVRLGVPGDHHEFQRNAVRSSAHENGLESRAGINKNGAGQSSDLALRAVESRGARNHSVEKTPETACCGDVLRLAATQCDGIGANASNRRDRDGRSLASGGAEPRSRNN